MTSNIAKSSSSRWSPHAVRNATFSVRIRGLDESEVHGFLEEVAAEIQQQEQEVSALRTEVTRLREEAQQAAEQESEPEISDQAVALFSQAQQVADNLIAEAVEHARDLMATARAQQRDIMAEAHSAAEAVVRQSGGANSDGSVGGYTTPVPDIEYVRTFARVAQVQLRSVLDALNDQVEKLGELPRLSDQREEEKPASFPSQLSIESAARNAYASQDRQSDVWQPPA
jgi:DivIVA domain-containing protein